MFTPRAEHLERGWPGRLDGERVIQLAAQTLESYFTGGGAAREHAVYMLAEVEFLVPVLRPPSIRFFSDVHTFEFGNTESMFGPGATVPVPDEEVEARHCVGALIGRHEQIGGFTLVNDWRAPAFDPPKDRDFATSVGPYVVTEYEDEGFPWEDARSLAARNTHLRAGDLLVAPAHSVEWLVAGEPTEHVHAELGTLRNGTTLRQ
jgi:hypothetical protein